MFEGMSVVARTNPLYIQSENAGYYRGILDGMSEGFALLSHEFLVLHLNAEALRLETRTRDEIVGRSHWELYPGSEHGPLGALYKQAIRDQIAVNLEHKHVWADGRVSWLDMRAFPTDDGCLAVFFRDVTERHVADQKLRESAERFQAAVSAVSGVLWTNDAEGRMAGEQPGWAALTGQSFDEYQDYGWSRAVHPDDVQPTLGAWQEAVEKRQPFVFEHRVRRHDGEWRRFAIRAVPVVNDDGSIREWVGVHSDVTEATEARRQLAANAATFETLVRNTPFGVYVVGSDFKLLHASQGTSRVFAGIDPLIGRDFAEILHILWVEPVAREFEKRFRQTLSTGVSYVSHATETQRRNVDQVEAYDWRLDRIALPDGQFGVVCYFYDLSERMALEAELKQAIADKDMLLREIDHRVRNSIAMVASLLSMQGGASVSADVRQALNVASARLGAIARIHERLYKGKELGSVEFGTYLEEICRDLSSSLGHGKMTMVMETANVDLPVDQAVPLGLIANELVTNAFKHCGDSAATISVDLKCSGTMLTLTIADSGIGMPENYDPSKKSGLGMRVIDMLVRQMNGSLVLPVPGGRACFAVQIPLAAEKNV